MTLLADSTITLRDGRTLAYTEHGDPEGQPVFFIHGNPGSRYMRHPDASIAQELGVRVITPDRPGYGLSDFQPGRVLLDFPDDLVQLAGVLEIEQFPVFGVSAGGPYVAACAYKLPERVTRAAIVNGAAPFDRENPYEGVNETYTQAYRISRWPEWMLRPLLYLQGRAERRNPREYWQGVMERASESDREVLSRPKIAAQVQDYRPEAARKGVRGWAREAHLLVQPWDFPLDAIQQPVHLWYWADDTIVPPQMGRYLESQLPNPIPHFLPGGGHFSFFDHWREILESLVKDEAE